MGRNPKNEEVTSLISRNINSGHEKEYDDWLRRYLAFERNAPGYLGTTIILPGGSIQLCAILLIGSQIRPIWSHGRVPKMRKIY